MNPPRRPSAPRGGVGLLGAAVVTLGLVRALHRPTKTPAATPASPPLIDGATSLAGGARITAVLYAHDPSRAEVLRVPGASVRRGDDTVAAPERLAAHGAVTAVPDGEHLLDARGELLRVGGDGVAALPGAEASPIAAGDRVPAARVVQRAGDFARMDSGALFALRRTPNALPVLAFSEGVRDVATDGEAACALLSHDRVRCALASAWVGDRAPNSLDALRGALWRNAEPLTSHDAEQVAVAGGAACVRARAGVFCARLALAAGIAEVPRLLGQMAPIQLLGEGPRATAMALSRDDLCLLGSDGRLRCVHGPQEDAAFPLHRRTDLRLHVAMDGVTEVGLTTDLGCVRRGGRIACWGPLARGGWVTRRERPVRVAGLREVSSLAASDGLVCALTRGSVWCWGVGPEGMRRPTPVRVELPAAAERIERTPRNGVCATLAGPRTRCWRDVDARDVYEPELAWIRPAAPPRAPVDPMGVGGALVWGDDLVCRAADGGVSCGARIDRGSDAPPLRRVEGLDDVAQVVMAGGLACARTGSGDVWCWGDNASGALTAAEAARSPRVVALRR